MVQFPLAVHSATRRTALTRTVQILVSVLPDDAVVFQGPPELRASASALPPEGVARWAQTTGHLCRLLASAASPSLVCPNSHRPHCPDYHSVRSSG